MPKGKTWRLAVTLKKFNFNVDLNAFVCRFLNRCVSNLDKM